MFGKQQKLNLYSKLKLKILHHFLQSETLILSTVKTNL
jgi:hypothetical protein